MGDNELPKVIKSEATVEERIAYATVHRCGKSYHIVLKMDVVKSLCLRGREEIKMVISKTGRSVPYKVVPPFIKRHAMKADVCSSDMVKPVVEEEKPVDVLEEPEPTADIPEEL